MDPFLLSSQCGLSFITAWMDRAKKRKSIAGEAQTAKTKMKKRVLNTLLELVDKPVSSSGVRHTEVAIILVHFKEGMLKIWLAQAFIQGSIFVWEMSDMYVSAFLAWSLGTDPVNCKQLSVWKSRHVHTHELILPNSFLFRARSCRVGRTLILQGLRLLPWLFAM